MMLNRQYHNLKQGDLSVDEYTRRMKLITVGLADIDHAVTKVDLSTQFLHGLDKRLDTIRVILGDTVPLPPFETIFSRVKLAEENLAQCTADESTTVLAVTGSDASLAAPPVPLVPPRVVATAPAREIVATAATTAGMARRKAAATLARVTAVIAGAGVVAAAGEDAVIRPAAAPTPHHSTTPAWGSLLCMACDSVLD